MDEYIVSARKYRPLNFDSVVGQLSLTTTLKNSIKSGKLAHVYLFCGPRGVGKTTCARIFAKAINCTSQSDGDACGVCESCRAFDEQRSLNIHELDAASNNTVDDIRELCKQVQIPPQTGRYKVFIIDEVHMLSSSAFNAFLKTLEEPPSYVVFILATTEKHKILPTILSRCQVYDFQRMTTQSTVDHLQYVAGKEGYTAEPEALALIAEKADGGMRDALSIFDQMVSFTAGNLTYELVCKNLNVLSTEYYFTMVEHFLKCEVEPCLLLLNEVLMKGFDAGNFIAGLAVHLRNLLVARDESGACLLEMSEKMKARYREQAGRVKPRFIYRAIKLCNDCDQSYRTSHNKRLQVEICLIQAAQLAEDDGDPSGRCPTKILKPIFSRLSGRRDDAAGTTTAAQKDVRPGGGVATQEANAVRPDASMTPGGGITEPSTRVSPQPMPQGSSPEKKPNLRHVTFKHFGKTQETGKVETAEEQSQQVYEVTPLTQDGLMHAWFSYCHSLPRELNADAQRMKGMQPKVTGTSTFEIAVTNPLVQRQMEEMYESIRSNMAKTLHNSELSFNIRLEEVREVQKMYNPAEELKAMMERYSPVRKLVAELSLQLE